MKEKLENNLKKCKKCKRIMPISDFYKNSATADGHSNSCKECDKKIRSKNKTKGKNVLKIADFTDETLFAEIRKRGYAGEVTYTKSVSI
jgi:acetyl-CoA carboxylase beta subunit